MNNEKMNNEKNIITEHENTDYKINLLIKETTDF